jgi:hypothetical protein
LLIALVTYNAQGCRSLKARGDGLKNKMGGSILREKFGYTPTPVLARYKFKCGLRSPATPIAIVISTELDFDDDLNFGGCESVSATRAGRRIAVTDGNLDGKEFLRLQAAIQ